MTSDALVLGPDSIVGSYRIVKPIGRGGMGAVFEAVHCLLPRRVAIKVMHAELRGNAGMGARMIQEAAILDELQHPGITRVFDCGLLVDRRPWIAMELIAGDSLATRLESTRQLPAREVCNLVAALADVLATAHLRGIVHRDLKPDNVLFSGVDDGFPLRIIDWGVARLGPAARLTLDGVTCGTPTYMSPEQAIGRDIAAPCDIYSLGVIAYEALSGYPPFDGRTILEVVGLHLHGAPAPLAVLCPAAPRALCDLIHQMLEKAPPRRPTAIEVHRRMEQLTTEIPDASSEFDLYEITTEPWAAMAPPPAADSTAPAGSSIEATAPRPRWTPALPSWVPPQAGYSLVRPRAGRCEIIGEIVRKH